MLAPGAQRRRGDHHSAAASCCCPARSCSAAGESYQTPWVFFAAADDGLDGAGGDVARLPAHPAGAPGDAAGDPQRLGGGLLRPRPRPADQRIAERAARVGVERFVLDDGWFRGRRDDTAGLGDWWVDEDGAGRDGLGPAGRARARSRHAVRALVRARDGQPRLRPLPRAPRLDPLRGGPGAAAAPQPAGARPDPTRRCCDYLCERVARDPGRPTPIDYVKWDHNRDLLEAGTGGRQGAPAAHEQTLAFYALLDDLRAAPPAGGLGVVRLRRWPDRPGRARAGAAGLDLRHDRRRRPPADPALDRAAGRPGVPRCPRLRARSRTRLAHPVAGLPRGHGALRRLRHRVGPHPRPPTTTSTELADWVDAAQAVPAAAAHGPAGAARVLRPRRPAARRGRARPQRGAVAHVQLDESDAQPRRRPSGCPASTPRRRTGWPGRAR